MPYSAVPCDAVQCSVWQWSTTLYSALSCRDKHRILQSFEFNSLLPTPIYTHTCTDTDTHTHTHFHRHRHTHTHILPSPHTHMYMYIYIHTQTRTHTHEYIGFATRIVSVVCYPVRHTLIPSLELLSRLQWKLTHFSPILLPFFPFHDFYRFRSSFRSRFSNSFSFNFDFTSWLRTNSQWLI
jgi:hypothetical protein